MRIIILSLLGLAGCADNACGVKESSGPPDAIEVLDHYPGPSFSELQDLESDGDIIWFCSGVIGLNAYDSSNPSKLKKLDAISFSSGNQAYPACQHLSVADDDRVYVSARATSLQPTSFIAVVDGSDPKNLIELGTHVAALDPEGTEPYGDLLLVAAHDQGLVVFDRNTGADLVERSRLELVNAWKVRIDGDIAWVADGEGGLASVDLSNPDQPTLLGRVALDGTAKDLEIVGDYVYVAGGTAGLHTIDISDPTAPIRVDTDDTPGSALGVAVGDSAIFVSDWNDLRAFDNADPGNPVSAAHEPLDLRGGDSRSLGLAADGDVIFSGNWTELVSYEYHPNRSGPDLWVSPTTLSMGNVTDSATTLITFTNVGASPVKIRKYKAPKALTFDSLPKKLDVGESVNALLELAVDGRWSGSAKIFSNDADEPRMCIDVEANQAGLGVGDTLDDQSFFTLDGDPISLSDYEGQPVLLAYFATF